MKQPDGGKLRVDIATAAAAKYSAEVVPVPSVKVLHPFDVGRLTCQNVDRLTRLNDNVKPNTSQASGLGPIPW